MKNILLLIILILFVFFSCNEDDLNSISETSYELNMEDRFSKNTDGVACIDNYYKFDYPKASNTILEKRPDFLWGIKYT